MGVFRTAQGRLIERRRGQKTRGIDPARMRRGKDQRRSKRVRLEMSKARSNSGSQLSFRRTVSRRSRMPSFIRSSRLRAAAAFFKRSACATDQRSKTTATHAILGRYVNAAPPRFHLKFTKFGPYAEKHARMAMNDYPTAKNPARRRRQGHAAFPGQGAATGWFFGHVVR